MEVTIQLDEELLAQAERLAASTGRTVPAVIEEALRDSLSAQAPGDARAPIRLLADGRGGLRPGVNLDCTAGLLDLMDAADAPG